MNKTKLEGQYEQLKGKLKESWGKLTDDDLKIYEGNRDQFLGKIKERYGIEKEEADKRVKAIEKSCGCK